MDNPLISALLRALGKAPQAVPSPTDAVDLERPWDSPVFHAPKPPVAGAPEAPLQVGQPDPVTPTNEALLLALEKQNLNADFARRFGGGLR